MAGANNNPVDEAVEVKRSHDEEEIKNAQGDVAEIKSSVDEAEKAESSLDEAKSSGDEESSADEEDSDRFGHSDDSRSFSRVTASASGALMGKIVGVLPLNDYSNKIFLKTFGLEGKKNPFSEPKGAASLVPPSSIAWRIYKNAISVFIGGITAVILEFAEPRVRDGVWDHTDFRKNPRGRVQRTGLALMLGIYGPADTARKLIERVNRMHKRVKGVTSDGQEYNATDDELLSWVHATANYSFLEAYHRYACRLTREERDEAYAVAVGGGKLYGVKNPCKNEDDVRQFFEEMTVKFEPSPIIDEFLDLMDNTPLLPDAMARYQKLLVRAAIDLVPEHIRKKIKLERPFSATDRFKVEFLASMMDEVVVPASPAAQACARLGISTDVLHGK